MTKEFLPYDRALKLKELGFDKPCFGSYIDGKLTSLLDSVLWGDVKGDLPAPLFQQAFRWFREEHGLGHMINGIGYESFLFNIGGLVTVFPMFKSYEEAELACLDKMIEILTKQQEQ